MRLLFLFAFLVTGCTQQELLSRIVSAEDQALATKYIDLLRARNFEEIEAALDARIRPPEIRDTLTQMAAAIPDGPPSSKKIVGAHVTNDSQGTTTNITFEYGFSGQWVLANVATRRSEESVSIVGFNVYPIPDALEEQNKLTLAGKSPTHYTVLFLAIAFPVLSIYALIVSAMTKTSGRRWPWVLFILFGIGTFSLNWTTGEVFFAPLQFQLLSASAVADLYSPWIISVSVPLGAIVFLVRRKIVGRRSA
jgi:hypothetical protein